MTRGESVLDVPDFGDRLRGRRECMMRGLFIRRWGKLLKEVQGLDPVDLLLHVNEITDYITERHLLAPVEMQAVRHIAVDCSTDDDVTVRFAVPFGGHADAVMHAHEQIDPYRPPSTIDDGPGSSEYRPALPPGLHAIVWVSGKWSDGVRYFEKRLEEWRGDMEAHLKRVNCEISDFNGELPGLVRDAILDRVRNARRADALAKELAAGSAGGGR